MSDLNLDNIVGFKAVDKDGNEQNVTVDEMVDMVSTRMVMALSETSTFAAAAATGNDVYENELPTVTDAANVRVLQSSGDAAQMTMQSLASKLGGLLPFTTFLRPYKSYDNMEPAPISWITERGIFLLLVHGYENPEDAYSIKIVISKTPGNYSPKIIPLGEVGMTISVGWSNTLQFSESPAQNVSIRSYKLI